jgi:hypothetical protein
MVPQATCVWDLSQVWFVDFEEIYSYLASPESPLLQREGFVQNQGVFMQFKKLMDSGISVRFLPASEISWLTVYFRSLLIRNGGKHVSFCVWTSRQKLIRPPEISTRSQVPPEEKLGGIKELNGVKYGEDVILGVPILLPAWFLSAHALFYERCDLCHRLLFCLAIAIHAKYDLCSLHCVNSD